MTLALAIAVGLASIASSAFTGISLRFLARQTRAATHQTELLSKQTQASLDQNAYLYAATELSFNLEDMMRLDEVLGHVARDDSLHREIWTNRNEGTAVQVAGDAILDVVAMALKACDRLPGFQTNEEDWKSFGEYLMDNSDRLRDRVLTNREWWPELAPYAQGVASQRRRPD